MTREVQAMFADIAPAYDRTNAVLSLGVHRRWRTRMIKASGVRRGDRVLDLATGTGALAFRLQAKGADVVGGDFCRPMLDVARSKDGTAIAWAQTDALALPFPDDTFDIASIGFGIRNVDDPVAGLAEMARVVRHGGRVVVLEFGRPRGVIARPYAWYSRYVLPRLGSWLTGNRAAYEYLPETAQAFPCGHDFVALMAKAASWSEIEQVPLTGGIAWLYVGTLDKSDATS